MSQFIHIVVFWIAVVVVIRAAVCFPNSLLARVLFWRIDPAPLRGEPDTDYHFRWARFAAGWFLQAAFLFIAGWIALGRDGSLVDSPYFLVFWAMVIPALGAAALLGALFAVTRAIWRRRHDRVLTHQQGGLP